MKQLVVISGKGGTGKTTVAASFVALAKNVVAADCDVDAANLHLLLNPQVREEEDFVGHREPRFDPEKCTGCGACVENCAFEALSLEDGFPRFDPFACEGCGLCARVCPTEAVDLHPVVTGQFFVSETRYGPLVHARLGVGQENSGKLVTQVRSRAAELAESNGARWLIVDGAPGIGCPVIASLAGADAVLVVSEPTPAGRSDAERVLRLASHFEIPALLCVNKWDLNPDEAAALERAACAMDLRPRPLCFVGRIPYDSAVPGSLCEGSPLVETTNGPAAQAIRGLWAKVAEALEAQDHRRAQ